MQYKKQTVGDLRKLLAQLPDNATYYPDWANDPPNDDQPGVEVVRFAIKKAPPNTGFGRKGAPYLSVQVATFDLNDKDESVKRIEDEGDDDEDD